MHFPGLFFIVIEEYGYKGRETMREKVFSCLEKWHMTEPGMRIVVVLSGGKWKHCMSIMASGERRRIGIRHSAKHFAGSVEFR